MPVFLYGLQGRVTSIFIGFMFVRNMDVWFRNMALKRQGVPTRDALFKACRPMDRAKGMVLEENFEPELQRSCVAQEYG